MAIVDALLLILYMFVVFCTIAIVANYFDFSDSDFVTLHALKFIIGAVVILFIGLYCQFFGDCPEWVFWGKIEKMFHGIQCLFNGEVA